MYAWRDVNVRHTELLMINVVVFLAVCKSLIKFIQKFIVVVGGGISYICREVL